MGFVFSPDNGTVDINDSENAIRIVKHLNSICGIGGAEGSSKSHISR
jgi:hypothetical protein